MAITSKVKGKSGVARVITYLVTEDNEVYLVYIYYKSQLVNSNHPGIHILISMY
jgi:hypothetical protein